MCVDDEQRIFLSFVHLCCLSLADHCLVPSSKSSSAYGFPASLLVYLCACFCCPRLKGFTLDFLCALADRIFVIILMTFPMDPCVSRIVLCVFTFLSTFMH
jgi:hypothetical protein